MKKQFHIEIFAGNLHADLPWFIGEVTCRHKDAFRTAKRHNGSTGMIAPGIPYHPCAKSHEMAEMLKHSIRLYIATCVSFCPSGRERSAAIPRVTRRCR